MENKTKKTQPKDNTKVEQPKTTPKNNNLSIAALVIGIMALSLCYAPVIGLILGVVAVILGVTSLKNSTEKGMSIAGIVMGGLSALISIIVTLVLIFTVVLIAEYPSHGNFQDSTVKTTFVKGETATFNNLAVKVNSVTRNYVPANNLDTASTGKELIVVNLDIKNISDEAVELNTTDLELNADGISNVASLTAVEPILGSGELSSGATTSGNVVFEVKKGASKLKLQYKIANRFDINDGLVNTVYTLDIE